ncbi:hypothetical protein [Nocardioides conyzicola]|uniref:Polysaccharide chain length determinant N-terminal domain-containing protein n=1 Tax=Nocardioides conyzicola TaxID=1651781 RepID=A0ABP8XQ88_9ACTN
MYFTEALAVLARRWYVVLVCGLAVVGGLVMAVKTVPTQYQASGEVLLLLPPAATGKGTPSNPYLNLQPGLTTMATITASELNSKPVHREVEQAGFTSDYAIGVSPDTGPLLLITVKDIDAAEAAVTRDEVIRRITLQLDTLQQGLDVPETQRVYSRRNGSARPAEAVPGAKIRAMAVIAGGGLVGTILLVFTFDRLSRRLRRRNDEEEPARDPGDADEHHRLTLARSVNERDVDEDPHRRKARDAAR